MDALGCALSVFDTLMLNNQLIICLAKYTIYNSIRTPTITLIIFCSERQNAIHDVMHFCQLVEYPYVIILRIMTFIATEIKHIF
jgi:hypothetical protein